MAEAVKLLRISDSYPLPLSVAQRSVVFIQGVADHCLVEPWPPKDWYPESFWIHRDYLEPMPEPAR